MSKLNTETGEHSGASLCSIFELVDVTDEETYYTMGLFETAEEAIRQASTSENNTPPCNEIGEDYVTMEVRKRTIGKLQWSETGEVVATVRWVRKYSDEDEDSDGKWSFSISNNQAQRLPPGTVVACKPNSPINPKL